MFVDMELYKVFYFVAKNKNITRASEELFVSQPAVSQSIKQLEEKLNVQLFVRLPKGVKLTIEGEILYLHVKDAYDLISSAEKKISEINNLESGEVTIGIDDIICKHYLLPIIEKYHNKYPRVKIKTANISTYETIEGIKRGNISFGVVKAPIEYANIKTYDCFDIKFCFVCNKEYINKIGTKCYIENFVNYPIISLDKSSSTREFMNDYFLANGLNIIPEIELSNFDMISEFSKIGLGIGFVIENFIEEDLKSGKLYKINIDNKIPVRKVAVAVHTDMPMSKPSQEFVNMIVNS